jgi:hypothetical protein
VTDRRIVVGCRQFASGSTYVGFGLVGAAVSLGLTALSRSRARNHSANHCLGGQLRYEWVTAVAFTNHGIRVSGPDARPAGTIHVDASGRDRWWRFSFCAVQNVATTSTVAEAIASTVIALRLAPGEALRPAQARSLERLGAPTLRPGGGNTVVVELTGATPVQPPATAPRRTG